MSWLKLTDKRRYILSRIMLFIAIMSFGLGIYDAAGNLHKRLVILGLMCFCIFEFLRERGD